MKRVPRQTDSQEDKGEGFRASYQPAHTALSLRCGLNGPLGFPVVFIAAHGIRPTFWTTSECLLFGTEFGIADDRFVSEAATARQRMKDCFKSLRVIQRPLTNV
jgi:hypothetical protein